MNARRAPLTGVERHFQPDELIVSKTDAKGRITYANGIFKRVSGYDDAELMGRPHNLVRHPDMPRAIFKLLWDTVKSGREIFAYVLNRSKNGDHYWVIAHVTPTFGKSGEILGFHSNRRVPSRSAIDAVAPLYKSLAALEAEAGDVRSGIEKSDRALRELLRGKGMEYDEFVLSL